MKNKSIVLIFFLLLIFFKTQAQPYKIEEDILQRLEKSSDTSKVWFYEKLSDYMRERDMKKSADYLKKGLELSQKIHFIKGEVKMYLLLGILEIDKVNYPKSLEYLLKSYKIAKDKRIESIDPASALVKISFIYSFYQRKDFSLKYANDATLMLKGFAIDKDNAYIYNSVASIYLTSGNPDKAIEILNRIRKEYVYGDDNNLQYNVALNSLVSCYSAKGQFDKALKYALLALSSLNDSLKRVSGMYLLTLNNIGNTYSNLGKYDSAVFYLTKSLNVPSEIDKEKWNAINYRDIGYVLLTSGNPKKAESYALNYIKISKRNDFVEDIKRGYKLLHDIYLREKNYARALEYLSIYSTLNDSLNSKEHAAMVMNVYLKNIIGEQEVQNKNLQSDNKKKELVIKDKQVFQIILIIISTFIFIFTIVVIYLFIQYRINNDLLTQQANEILQKNSQLGSQNHLLTQLNEEIKGIIGIVSHDLKAPLNRIESLIGFVSRTDNLTKDQQSYLAIATKELSNSKDLIKKILIDTEEQYESQKIALETFDIYTFINEIKMKYSIQSGNKNIALLSEIPSSVFEINTNRNYLSRILDNLLSNAIKFSEPGKSIYLNAVEYKNYISLAVKDQGPGFSDNDLENLYKKYHKLSAKSTAGESSSGLGLYIVKQLAFEIGIAIDVESKLGYGTTFTLKIPSNS